ncbi:unnamed protein product [Rotaria sp. Silwood1]|nr:unnamed protein product [Rotaria sp. Silwood1]
MPVSLRTADVNSDGKLDIIVVGSDTNSIDVLFNNGDSTFPKTKNYVINGVTSLTSVTAADVNGDGKADIIVGGSSSNNVGVFLNNGDGTFPDTKALAYGSLINSAPESVTTADVNGDGKVDIIVANKGTHNVGVLLNSGTGTFPAAPVTYGLLTNSAPTSVTTTDVNGDGKPDIIVGDSGTNTFGVLFNNGDGTFPATQVTYSTGAGTVPASVVAGDLNGDGRADITVANSGTNTIGVFLAVCT